EQLERGVERPYGHVKADLVVPLAGRAVANPGRTLSGRDLDEQLGDQRAPKGGGQGVLPLVERAGLQRRPAEPLDEGLTSVEHVGAHRSRGQGPLPDRLEVWLATEVDRQRDHVEPTGLG